MTLGRHVRWHDQVLARFASYSDYLCRPSRVSNRWSNEFLRLASLAIQRDE